MASAVSREDFNLLEARVSVVEREVNGEKTVSRYILEQTRRNGDDIAGIKTRLDRVESDLSEVKSDVKGVKFELAALRKDLPGIVADTMREVLRETGKP